MKLYFSSLLKRSKVPEHLTAASIFSAATGIVGIIQTILAYSHYTPALGDQQVKMSIPVTGIAVGVFFTSFIVISLGLWHGKTWAYSALVLTSVILGIICFTIFKAGQIPLGIIFAFITLNFLFFLFCRESLAWYKGEYAKRMKISS